MIRYLTSLLALALVAGTVHADSLDVTVPAGSAKLGITIAAPEPGITLEITASSGNGIPVDLYVGAATFNADAALADQADYFATMTTTHPAKLAIGSAKGVGESGRWHLALVNRSSTHATTVTMKTSAEATSSTPIVVSFAKPSPAFIEDSGGADALDCNVAPWTDTDPAINSDKTLGEYRRDLVLAAAEALSQQINSAVPIHIQACWKAYEDDDSSDGSYTLAAARATYSFRDASFLPLQNTWYPMALASHLLGSRVCHIPTANLDCTIPDIIVWFNSADEAKNTYNGVGSAAMMKSVTMHEITHGLGFLSTVDIAETTDDGSPNPHFTQFWKGRNDVYTLNVAYHEPVTFGVGGDVVPFANLSTELREEALTSGTRLVWNDPDLAASEMNALRNNPTPENLVQLYAPAPINSGSTLSHINGYTNPGQLMSAYIQRNYPMTLGLAGPMLAAMGWGLDGGSVVTPSADPVPGPWYDPAHSGHGIDLELVKRVDSGDLYNIIFYTYDANGNPEYYIASGRMHNGHLGSTAEPEGLFYPIYDPAQGKATFPEGKVGSIALDFTAAAATSEACAGHGNAALAVMHWTLRGDSGAWCISPGLGREVRPADDKDLNGVWFAGANDGGWGLTLKETNIENGPHASVLLYYYGRDNQPRWAQTAHLSYAPGTAYDVYAIHGYCRTCAMVPTNQTLIGSLTLNVTHPEQSTEHPPSGDSTITVNIGSFGGPYFHRTDAPLGSLSVEPGQ